MRPEELSSLPDHAVFALLTNPSVTDDMKWQAAIQLYERSSALVERPEWKAFKLQQTKIAVAAAEDLIRHTDEVLGVVRAHEKLTAEQFELVNRALKELRWGLVSAIALATAFAGCALHFIR